ncbi:MAG TPA: hypothetical protein VM165_09135 [Planctomycetaceae bacterium]|nr:hypothetical protein [Planctomycetaceae bacterium]
MSHRFLLTFAVVLCLTGMYGVYAAVTRPMLALPVLSVPAAAGIETDQPRPVENMRIAETHLSHQPWVKSAKYLLRSHDAFVYANEWQPEGNEGRVRLWPFAMAWVTKDAATGAEEVVTVVAESAVVKFAGSFELPSPEPGRMVAASLEGRAQVAGPKGLVIDGRDFFFSEPAQKLWSDQPVSFAYAGNRGSADILQLDLIPQQGPAGKDRPHVYGVKNVRLSRNVKMDLQLKQRGEPLSLKIKCAGSFDYDLERRVASYTTDVVASRETSREVFDWIECDRMQIEFGGDTSTSSADASDDGYQHLDSRLKFQRMSAFAAKPAPQSSTVPVIRLFSMQHKLRCQATQLDYEADRQTLRLIHPQTVRVLQANSEMQSPAIELGWGTGGRLQSANCAGPGWMIHRDPQTKEALFAAEWEQQLRQTHDPQSGLDLLELHKTASFRQPTKNSALGAELIRVWYTTPADQSNPIDGGGELSPPIKDVQPQRLEASRDVVLISPQLEATTQHLEVWLDASLPMIADTASNAAGTNQPFGLTTGGNKGPTTGKVEPPPTVVADRIRVRLRPGEKTPSPADIWTEGRVRFEQRRPNVPQPLVITGDQVHIENHGAERQIAHVHGKPGHIKDASLALEAQSMHLDRADNRLWVDGAGLLQLPVKTDIDGKPLPKPQPLDVQWKERMSFDGRLAAFHGDATAVLGDRRMTCETMQVTLSEGIRFDRPPAGSDRVQLASIYCRNDVELNHRVYVESKLTEVLIANVWELRIDRESGELHAQGPGDMSVWRRDAASQTGLPTPQTAKPNRPTQIDDAEWEYSHVKFDGQMRGNLHRRHATFLERVEIVHGPVQAPDPSHAINPDAPLPKAAGFLKCAQLDVSQSPPDTNDRRYIQLAGQGNAELDGQGFFASADQITYDAAKKSYILQCKGKNKARIWRRGGPGELTAAPTVMQRMEFIPATNTIRADGISGGEGSQ